MWWNICICLVWLTIAITAVVVIISCIKKKTGLTKPANIFFAGVVVSVFIGVLPVNCSAEGLSDNIFFRSVEAVSLSIVNVMQAFTTDLNGQELLDNISNQKEQFLQKPYITTMSVLCTVAPLLTVGFLISLLMSLSARIRYMFNCFKPVCIFSELNERTVTLAENLKKDEKYKNSVIVFTDVIDRDEEMFLDLLNRAKSLGAIIFKDDILSLNFQRHSKKSKIYFFLIGDSESENIVHALTIIDKYKEREETFLYLVSSTKESELALAGVDKGKIKVHRINDVRNLIYRTLYEKGYEILFKKLAEDNSCAEKHINAIVMGMGNYGTEMVKALSWLCQMDGYKLTIHAFDIDEKAETKFKTLCPDLLSPAYNGVYKEGEAYYSITVHSGVDVYTSEFSEYMASLKDECPATYVFVSLGADEYNISAAVNMRMICRRLGVDPVIQAVVRNPFISRSVSRVKNFRNEAYDIDCIGDICAEYSENVIIDSDLEKKALERHMKWVKDKPQEEQDKAELSFWTYEYNYNSSIAPIIHYKVRNKCGVYNSSNLNTAEDIKNLSEEDIIKLKSLEHRRWNAYMRADGYITGKRNDIAKMHHDLVAYNDLSPEEQNKDDII